MNPAGKMTQRCNLVLRLIDEDNERDELNDVIPVTVTLTDVPCLLQQSQNVAQRGETEVGGQVQVETFRLFLPHLIEQTVDEDDEPIEPIEVHPDGIDAITVDGVAYELHGPPWRAFNPRLRRVTHVEATVKRGA